MPDLSWDDLDNLVERDPLVLRDQAWAEIVRLRGLLAARPDAGDNSGVEVDAEYADEDASGMLLLIGSEDDGCTYLSVQDREPVILAPDQAEQAGRQLLARARAGRP